MGHMIWLHKLWALSYEALGQKFNVDLFGTFNLSVRRKMSSNEKEYHRPSFHISLELKFQIRLTI